MKQKSFVVSSVTPPQDFIVVGASGAMGQLIIRKAISLGHTISHGIVGPDDEMGHILYGPEIIKLQKINEFNWRRIKIYYENDDVKPIIIDATHESVVKENWETYYKSLGFPVIFITTGITKEDLIGFKNHMWIASPNACPELVSVLLDFKNMPGSGWAVSEKFGPIHYGITELHQGPDPARNFWGKKNPSSTGKFVDDCLTRAGHERVYFESIRDRSLQLLMGVPPEHLDGHAWHTYRFMSEKQEQLERFYGLFCLFMDELREYGDYEVEASSFSTKASSKDKSIIFELRNDDSNIWFSHFVNGRQPYVDGLFSRHFGLGNFVARITDREPAVYDMFDLA